MMNEYQKRLWDDLMALQGSEAFYFTDQKVGDQWFRIFNYRLASYTEFQRPGALESRGHTFEITEQGEPVALVCMPMQKFFNLGENPMVMNLDLSMVHRIMDKLDGSLISTVQVGTDFIFKTKGSFYSDQAKAAWALLQTDEYKPLRNFLRDTVRWGYTVNMEYCAPDNQIVIGYSKPMLRVLNVRSLSDGSYRKIDHRDLPPEMVVETFATPENPAEWVESVGRMKGREGFVVELKDGTLFKLKTEEYAALHKTKDNINSPRKLFEVCVLEGADDLRGLFRDDPLSVAKITDMESKVAVEYNHVAASVEAFYNTNKELDRKSYAIKGQAELAADGTFSLAMNLYIGRKADYKEFMIKNYPRYKAKFGLSEEPTAEE